MSFGSARATGAAARAAGGSSGEEARTEEDERAVAVAGAQVLYSDAARVRAVRADRHDCVVVTQVLGTGAGATRRGTLIAGECVGDLRGRTGAEIPRAACVMGVFAIVGSNKRANILVLQRYSEYQAGHRCGGQRNGHHEQTVAAHG